MTNPLWRAIVVIMLGLFAFEMMGVIVRTLGSDYPILQISVLRNFFRHHSGGTSAYAGAGAGRAENDPPQA